MLRIVLRRFAPGVNVESSSQSCGFLVVAARCRSLDFESSTAGKSLQRHRKLWTLQLLASEDQKEWR